MEMMRELLAAAGVLLLLGAVVLALRRRAGHPRGRARLLTAVERLPLSPHHSVHLVRLGDRGLLIGVSPSGCAVLERAEWSRFERAAPSAEAPR